MSFFKKLSNKIDSFLQSQIDKQDLKSEELKNQKIEREKKEIENLVINPEFKKNPSKDLGMYFMDLSKNVVSKEFNRTISDFYFALGCASQGRKDDFKTIYKNSKNEDQDLYYLLTTYKERIDKMMKVSARVEAAGIGLDIRDNESTGEYESRKLNKSKVFMDEFNFFVNLSVKNVLKNQP
jgi:hypothetical protein